MRYLGIDWGFKKIGLSFSEGDIATPFSTLAVKNMDMAIKKILKVAEDELIDKIVIGKSDGEMGKIAEKGKNKLQNEGFEVEMVDETLSTAEAKLLMIQIGLGKEKRKDDNSISAAIILQRWLDSQNDQ